MTCNVFEGENHLNLTIQNRQNCNQETQKQAKAWHEEMLVFLCFSQPEKGIHPSPQTKQQAMKCIDSSHRTDENVIKYTSN